MRIQKAYRVMLDESIEGEGKIAKELNQNDSWGLHSLYDNKIIFETDDVKAFEEFTNKYLPSNKEDEI